MRTHFTLKVSTSRFIRIVTTIIVVVTPPSVRNAFPISGTPKLALRTLSVHSFAHAVGFVRIVCAVVFVIAKPPP